MSDRITAPYTMSLAAAMIESQKQTINRLTVELAGATARVERLRLYACANFEYWYQCEVGPGKYQKLAFAEIEPAYDGLESGDLLPNIAAWRERRKHDTPTPDPEEDHAS